MTTSVALDISRYRATGEASAAVGAGVHMVLSMAYGLASALLASRLRTNGSVALAGGLFGVALHVVDFLVLAPLAFSVFQDANQPVELVVHVVVFGVLLSLFFFGAGVRREEPVLALSSGR